MPAVIQSTLYDAPGGAVVAGSTQQNSRDDLRLGYQVVLHSVHEATTYSWTLAFASDSPGTTVPGTPFDGTPSSAALLPPEGSTSRDAKFNVDFEGTYLIRLVVDAGTPTEDTQFIRCRVLTMFGALKLVAAGERRDENGVIPVDASAEGWANDQNANLQRISLLLRRYSTSGRVLYVDANRGRDNAADQDDYDNIIAIPGPDAARREATGIKLRAMAHGDFSSINDAIAYAAAAASRGEPAPSKTDPYYIYIRPGFYNEDLNLVSFVHLIGDTPAGDRQMGGASIGPQVKPVVIRTVNTGGTGTHTYNPEASGANEECFLSNLYLENTGGNTFPVVFQQGGLLLLERCVVRQGGNTATQGPAFGCVTSNASYAPQTWLVDTEVNTEATTATRVAVYFDAPDSYLGLIRASVAAPSCQSLVMNESLYQSSSCTLWDSALLGVQPFQGYPSLLGITSSVVTAGGGYPPANPALDITPPGGAGSKPGAVVLSVDRSTVTGTIRFLTANATGTTSMSLSGLTHRGFSGTGVVLPDAPGDLPNTAIASTRADSLWYMPAYADFRGGPGAAATIPAANRVSEQDVQRILDLLWLATFPVTGSPFYDLDSAYNGLASISPFTPGVGLGRNINALGGAVQVQGAANPTGLDSHLKHGGLQIEGIVDIGGFINGADPDTVASVGGSEIHLNPNQTGAGPFVGLGRANWPGGVSVADRGFAGAFLVAGGAQTGDHAYNLHLRTTDHRAPNTGKTGNIYVVAGGIGDTAGADDAGELHLIGGSHANPAGAVGNVWLVPGNTDTPSAGVVWFVGAPTGASRGTLSPRTTYGGVQAGSIYFGTPTGIETFTFTGAEPNAAAVAASINGQAKHLHADVVGGKVTLYSEYGPAGDILYLGDTVGGALNTSLGNYIQTAGATFTPGTYGHKVAVDVPQNGRFRVLGDLEYTGSLIPAPGGGSGFGNYVQVDFAASPYTVAAGVALVGCDTTGGSINVLLPQASAASGRVLVIKHEVGAFPVVLTPFAGDTVAGDATYRLVGTTNFTDAPGHTVALYSDGGTDWKLWSEYQSDVSKLWTVTSDQAWLQTDKRQIASVRLSPGVDITLTLDSTLSIGRTVVIKDESGVANAIPSPAGQKIIVVDNGGGTFDGAASLDITSGYASVTLYKNDLGNWSVI